MHNTKHPNIIFRYWLAALFFATAGLLIALYSAHSHYQNYTDPLYSSFCAISKAINCDTVAQSPWSIMLGVPVAWWGVLFYLFFLLILLTEDRRNLAAWRGWLFVMSISSAVTLGLAGIAIWKIKSLCLVCLATYTVTFGLTYICWLGQRRCKEAFAKGAADVTAAFHLKTTLQNYSIAAGVFCVSLLLLYGLMPRYWLLSAIETSADISNLPHGLTEDGHPWIGAEEPLLTIAQFSDYQCFQCGKMYFLLRNFLAKHPDTLRLVHRHYPLDHEVNSFIVPEPFHEGSGKLAKVAILAAMRDKFWQTNDLLYALTRSKGDKVTTISLKDIANKTGLNINELAASLTHPAINARLSRDIREGMKLKITGTPAFLIDGQVYQGQIPPQILKKINELPE
ncbi:vitamin K epoxide reductase/DsbA family protein [Candidatus Electrothrix sp.]|uniref:vitamin K epoxide reductase/DsbA family protein n=1 Tax=Candidatus Electrothrix sp. TaxID=2170559 RepID=UPI004055C12A